MNKKKELEYLQQLIFISKAKGHKKFAETYAYLIGRQTQKVRDLFNGR